MQDTECRPRGPLGSAAERRLLNVNPEFETASCVPAMPAIPRASRACPAHCERSALSAGSICRSALPHRSTFWSLLRGSCRAQHHDTKTAIPVSDLAAHPWQPRPGQLPSASAGYGRGGHSYSHHH